MQSTLLPEPRHPLHVAIVMDGNGRWAQRRGLPRSIGHKAGVDAIRRIVEAASDQGIGTLSLFAFSADNWKRPAAEVATLMRLLRTYLRRERRRLLDANVRLTVIGRRDRLPEGIAEAIGEVEAATAQGTRLHLRIAIDYSARDAILAAALACRDELSREALAARLGAGDVDLLIRTSGEQRLSDFMLWECAYAELRFVETLWPDFDGVALNEAITDFRRRDRRYGGLAPVAASAAA